jgi:putative tributyrin esterase
MSAPHPFRTLELSDPAIDPRGLRFATVKSAALRQRADVTLWLPLGADQHSDLPVAILLHGVYGSHWAWALNGDAHGTAGRLIEAGAIPPMALLMPSDGLWGDGSGYVRHRDQDFEAWIVEELPALAAAAAPGCSADSPLLLAGLSMGGFAALRLAGKHPGRFRAVAAHSAMTELAQYDALLAESREAWRPDARDASALVALESATRLPPLRFDCGRDDAFIEANRALHAALDARRIAHQYAEHEGGHDWSYWSRHLEDTLRFFGAALGHTPPTREDA